MNELESRIAQLNNSAKKINLTRQQSIGRRETLLKQQEDAINAYNKKYGRNITADTVEAEYKRVSAEKQAEAEKIEQIISAIESGNFELANQLSGVEPEKPASSADDTYVEEVTEGKEVGVVPEAEVAPATQEPVGVSPEPVQPVVEEPVKEEPVQPTAPKGTEFIPSPISNPMSESGTVHGMQSTGAPLGGSSIFDRDFSASSEDDDMGTPPAPPSLAGLI